MITHSHAVAYYLSIMQHFNGDKIVLWYTSPTTTKLKNVKREEMERKYETFIILIRSQNHQINGISRYCALKMHKTTET